MVELLNVEHVRRTFPRGGGEELLVLDDVNLTLKQGEIVDAEECLRQAFFTDVRPMIRAWRESKGLAEDPLAAFRQSGYLAEITKQRAERNKGSVSSYA